MNDPFRRCPRCDCPDSAPQCDHCKVCPHADSGPEASPELSEVDQLRADAESLRQQIRRVREALGTDEPDETADLRNTIARVRSLHREEYGSCAHCTRADSVPWPCPTIRVLNGEAP